MQRERGKFGHPFNAILALAVGCVVFFAIFARQAAEEMLFRPGAASYQRDESFTSVEAKDGKLLNVFWAEGSGDGWTLLYFYGSDEDIGSAMPRLNSYQLKGFNVACFDYRGYGYTSGKPTEEVLYDDAETVFEFIVREKGIPESKIVLHGRSVGGGVAMELATRRSPAGLILESTFRSAFNAILLLKWVPGDSFENERKAPETSCPVLLIHGEADETFDISHSVALHEAFGAERAMFLRIPGAGHRDVAERGGVSYWKSIELFVHRLK